MKSGAILSGVLHGVFILAALTGLPWLSPGESEPVRVTDVSIVSSAEFDAARQAAAELAERRETAPPAQSEPVTLEMPESQAAGLPEVFRGRPPGAVDPVAEPDAPLDEDLAILAPQFNAEQPLEVPSFELSIGVPESDTATHAPTSVTSDIQPRVIVAVPPASIAPPMARPAQRIDTTVTPAPPEQARPAELATPETAPAPDATEPEQARPPEAPPEAAPEPAAEPAPPVDVALAAASRPVARPANAPQAPAEPARAPAVPVETAGATPVTPAAPATLPAPSEPAPPEPAQTSQAQPVEEQPPEEPPEAPASSLPVGPPLSIAEKDGMRFAVQQFWNPPAGLRDLQELRVVIAADLAADGAIITGSIRLIEPDPLPDTRFQQAFEAGRRALIRGSPYSDLPREKYAHWRRIEVIFNPEGMVSW